MRLSALISVFCWLGVCHAFGPRKLYTLNLPTTINSIKVMGRQIVFVGPWYISVVDNVQWKFMQKSRMSPRIINKDIPSPRMIGKIPSGTFKGSKETMYWVTTWGTNQTSGAVYVMKQTHDYSEWGDISIDAGWNYERTQWVDMNRDGLRDCLTARFRGGVGQMLYFQQPPGQTIWGQKIIHEGMADGNFVGFYYDKKTYIIVAGNQFSSLGLYWTLNKKNNWLYSRQIRHRVVDNYGRYYDVQYVDLNKDGRADILTTTVQISSSRGHVLGYEIPYDIQNKMWTRRVLAAGFNGDYSPGKAIAYFPNKWKQKSDRPSIFLSGAGEEQLYILSPRPKNSGWAYVKSVLKVGTGMIGIPYIVDLNGDSYPELFVPQGNQVHVFSYDYSSSAALAPLPASRRTTTSKPVFPYRNPFFRPTTPPPRPAIPPGATPYGPLPDNIGPDGRQLPPRTNILGRGSSQSTGGGSSGRPYYPSLPQAASQPQGGPALTQIQSGNIPRPLQSNLGPTGGLAQLQSRPSFNSPPRPLGPSQQQYLSNARPQVPGGNPSVVRPNAAVPRQPVARNPSQYQQPYKPQEGAPAHSGVAPVRPNNHGLVLGQDGQWYQPVGFQNQVPFYPRQHQANYQTTNTSNKVVNQNQATELVPGQERASEQANTIPITPSNLVLSVTKQKYNFYSEAVDACSFEKKVLCNVYQLQDAVHFGGEVPKFEWGWFAIEGRAATLEDCSPGDVKWEGYVCHNGMVAHLPILNDANLPALCCSVLNWAKATKKRYSRVWDAQMECQNMSRHLCSKEEMYTVWRESSYKGHMWGWFTSENQLLRMTHYCDPKQILWSGYKCLDSRFEVTEILSHAQEKGFCCPGAAQTNSCFEPTLVLLVALSLFYVLI